MKTVEEFMALLRQKLAEQREKKTSYRQQVINEIRKKYSLEDEIALINNYNLYRRNPALSNYKHGYDTYQANRVAIKEKIKEAENESTLDES